jgi:hypothetical protein
LNVHIDGLGASPILHGLRDDGAAIVVVED